MYHIVTIWKVPATEPAMSGHISAVNAAATGSVGAPF